jgi:hypothetical protein
MVSTSSKSSTNDAIDARSAKGCFGSKAGKAVWVIQRPVRHGWPTGRCRV